MGHNFVQGWTQINPLGDRGVHYGLEFDEGLRHSNSTVSVFEGFPKLRWACGVIELISNGRV